MYMLLKHLHVTLALLTFISFFVRGLWMWKSSQLLQQRWVKIAPHIIDTLLLMSALLLAYHLKISPGNAPWLLAKIIGLAVFIFLGLVSFKHSDAMIRKSAWLSALLVFIYIVGAAISKNPLVLF